MKKKTVGLALSGLLILAGCGANSKNYAEVNGKPVAQSVYDQQMKVYTNMIVRQNGVENIVKQSLIRDEVIRQDLEAHKIQVTDEEKQKDYKAQIEKLGGVTGYEQLLKNLNITDEEYKQLLLSETMQKLHREMYNKEHPVSDKDIKEYYEKNKTQFDTVVASHILVKTEDEAKKVKERLNKGEDFAKVAKEVSTDVASAQKGGSLGESSPSTYVKEFSDALMALKEGEISEPVKTQFGYHIIRLDKKKIGWETQKDKISDAINIFGYQKYLQDLISKAKVEIKGEQSEKSSTSNPDQSSTSESTTTSEVSTENK